MYFKALLTGGTCTVCIDFDRCVFQTVLWLVNFNHHLSDENPSQKYRWNKSGQKWPNHGTHRESEYTCKSNLSLTYLYSGGVKKQVFSPFWYVLSRLFPKNCSLESPSALHMMSFESHMEIPQLSKGVCGLGVLLLLVWPCPSFRSISLWSELYLLCILHNTSRIHFLFTCVINQIQKVCCFWVCLFLNSKIWILAIVSNC